MDSRHAELGIEPNVSPEHWQGRLAQIHLFSGTGRDVALARCQGVVVGHSGRLLHLELIQAFDQSWYLLELVIEIRMPHATARFESRPVRQEGAEGNPHHLTIRLPEQVEMAQRRRYQRVDLALPVTVQVGGEGRPRLGRALNLSGGGMALLLSDPIEVGAELSLEFVTPENIRFYEVPAVLIRTQLMANGQFCAIQFVNLHPDVRALLESMVLRMLTGHTEPGWRGKVTFG